jgi:DNA-binding MarR family transcriptional regulator
MTSQRYDPMHLMSRPSPTTPADPTGTQPPAAPQVPLSKLLHELLVASDWMRAQWRDELGLSSYELQAVLHVLHSPMSVGDLGRRLHLTSGAMTALVTRLSERGLIERTRHSTDGRKVALKATDEAQQRVWKIIKPVAERVDEVARQLDPRSARMMGSAISSITRVYTHEAEKGARP